MRIVECMERFARQRYSWVLLSSSSCKRPLMSYQTQTNPPKAIASPGRFLDLRAQHVPIALSDISN
jgi:hypothetical protein